MLQELKDRITYLKRDIIEEIREKGLPKEVSIRCDDPYSEPETPSVEIYKIKITGVMTEEYDEAIPFNEWSVETLICILEELEGK